MKKEPKPKPKKYTLTLSEPEVRRLTAYAAESGIERPVTLHRIVSQALRDSVQIDIFNNTTKV